MFTGTVVAASGLLTCAFATNMLMVALSVGIVTGDETDLFQGKIIRANQCNRQLLSEKDTIVYLQE